MRRRAWRVRRSDIRIRLSASTYPRLPGQTWRRGIDVVSLDRRFHGNPIIHSTAIRSGIPRVSDHLLFDAYRAGSVTAWRAAEIAGVSLYEMLDQMHEDGVAYELDPAVLDRVDELVQETTTGREAPATYDSDAQFGIDQLRGQFKPRTVTTLFVGESSPAGGTHFYRANSNLFRATQEAFAQAFGDESMSEGPRFLREFQDHGCWLVDLADRSVNALSDEERQMLVSAGVAGLATTITEVRPTHIVAVKATIDDEVRSAMEVACSDAELLALPFPVRQWRAKFVSQLASALHRWAPEE